jgi:hypothetical protein
MKSQLEIRIAPSADGKHVMVRMPFANGAAEILLSVGAKWRRSLRAWAIPADRVGDLECRIGDLRALVERQWRP